MGREKEPFQGRRPARRQQGRKEEREYTDNYEFDAYEDELAYPEYDDDTYEEVEEENPSRVPRRSSSPPPQPPYSGRQIHSARYVQHGSRRQRVMAIKILRVQPGASPVPRPDQSSQGVWHVLAAQ